MKRFLSYLLICTMLFWLPSLGHAIWGVGDITFDPSNYAINLLTQANTLRSAVSDAQAVSNQIRQMAMEAQNLVQTPLNIVNSIQSSMNTYSSLLQQARGMGYSIQSVVSQFENVFTTGGFGVGDLLRKAQAMQSAIQQAGAMAAQSQAIFDRLCLQAANASTALQAAKTAPGNVAVQQANAQLLGVIIDQQASLQQVMAATGRIETEFIMMQVTDRQQGEINATHWLEGFGSQGFKNVGEGQGIRLP